MQDSTQTLEEAAPIEPVAIGRVAAPGVSFQEPLLYAALSVAMMLVALSYGGGPFGHALQNDSYQYLSVAENLRLRGEAATSIVHFDVERAHGRIPAPLTTFPPGYPAVIALLTASGMRAEWAAVLISMVCTASIPFVLWRAGRAMGLTPQAQRAVMLLWAFSAQAALLGSSALSEPLFTLVGVAAVTTLLSVEDRAAPNRRIVGAAVLVGLGWWVRYAGSFLVLAFNLVALSRIAKMRRARLPWARSPWLLGAVLCDAIVIVGLIRNVLVAGTWRGGNTRAAHHAPWETMLDAVLAHLALFLGDASPWTAGLAALLSLTVVVIVLVLHRASSGRVEIAPSRRLSVGLVVWILVYVTGILYARTTTDIALEERMFFPILPLYLLLAGLLVTAAERSWPRRKPWPALRVALAVALGVAYAGSNLAAILRVEGRSPHVVVARALAEPTEDGRSLSERMAEVVPRDGVLLATYGQATGYVLNRRTVSLISKRFSDVSWEADETRRTMDRFGARHVLVYRVPPERHSGAAIDRVTSSSQLLRALETGSPPEWLELVAASRSALVYRRKW